MLTMEEIETDYSNAPVSKELHDKTTERLKDIDPKKAYQILLKYLITDKIFAHPDFIDLDYQLVVKDANMIITKSDKPIVPKNERALKGAKFSNPTKLVSKDGLHAPTGTYTYEISDEVLDSLGYVGYERITLKRDDIQLCINRYLKHKQQAVITWFAYKHILRGKSLEQNEANKEFESRYGEHLEYILHADPETVKQYLYYSIKFLVHQIIYYQR